MRANFHQHFNRLRGKVLDYRKSNDDDKPIERRMIQEEIRELFAQHRVFASESALGQFVRKTRETDVEHADYIAGFARSPHDTLWAALHNGDTSGDSVARKAFRAAGALALFESGVRCNESEKAAIKAMKKDWDASFQSLSDKFRDGHEDIRSSLNALNANTESAKSAADNLLVDHEERMREIEKDYKKRMSVLAPVGYWNRKKKMHWAGSVFWGVVAAVTFGFGIWELYEVVITTDPAATVREMLKAAKIEGSEAQAAYTQALVTAAFRIGFLSLLVIWPVRIFVRNYISHQHLASDAAERVVSIQTYLALLNEPILRDDKDVKAAALEAVLERIFRPGSDGIVRDDGAPTDSILAAIKNLKTSG